MARQWFGRKERSDQDPDGAAATGELAIRTDTDPISDEAESEREEEPTEIRVEPETADVPSPADRPAAPTRGALAGVGAAAIARLPAVRAAIRPRLPRLALAVGGGLLLFASFPPVNWWWAAVVAAALLAWVLRHPATTLAGGMGYGFLFGLAFYLPLLRLAGQIAGAPALLVLITVCAGFPALFGLLAVVVRTMPGWPLWFAVLWAAQEWLKCTVPFGGFPWGVVGFGQTDGPLLPLVRLGGVPLLSAAVVLLGCSATAIAQEIVLWWQTTGRRRGRSDAPPAVVLPGICICLVLFAAIVIWPQVRHSGMGAGNEPTVNVAAVQGNVPQLGLTFNPQRRAVLDNHLRETMRLAEDVHAGHAPQPQFVVWPEGSSDIDPLINADAGRDISAAAAAIGAPILVGTTLGVPGQRPDSIEYTNTVIVWNPVTGPADRHNKQIIMPFGEYMPLRWLFRHLSGYTSWVGHMVPGKSTGVVRAAGIPVGVATCWEVLYDRAARESVRNGAQMLVVPTNNSAVNPAMSNQHLAFAKARAVEHDRYVVVAGTVGISAVIAPDGQVLASTDFFEPTYLDMQVRLKTTLTPATRWGPIVQWVLVGAAGAVILAGIRHNGWFVRPIRPRSRPRGESEYPGTPADQPEGDHAAPDDEGGDHTPSAEGGDYTPLHQGGRRPFRYLGRHRGAT